MDADRTSNPVTNSETPTKSCGLVNLCLEYTTFLMCNNVLVETFYKLPNSTPYSVVNYVKREIKRYRTMDMPKRTLEDSKVSLPIR